MPDLATINGVAEDNIATYNGTTAANVTGIGGATWVHESFNVATGGDQSPSSGVIHGDY